MDYLTSSFWKFPHDSKIDVLQEPQHTHLILAALRDRETSIELESDGTFILYGPQDGLLVVPQLITTRLLLYIYSAIRPSAAF